MEVSSADSHAISHQFTVSSLVARGLVAAVERVGVPRERFLQTAKLDPSLLEHDRRLPYTVVFSWCEAALDVTGDPAFGLHWGEWVTVHTFNLVPQLLAHCPTVRHAFEALFQFGGLLTDRLNLRLIERDDEVELQMGSSLGSLRVQRFVAELSLLGLHHMLRDFGPHAAIHHVNFGYPAPEYRAEYTRVFEGAERFGQACTGIVFDRALMDAPSAHQDGDIQRSLHALAERRLSLLQRRAPYAVRVRELLLQEHAPHRVAMQSIAQALDVSLRTLHRHLTNEGRPYRKLANEAAACVAQRLLAEEQRTIQEAAFIMRFCDATSFHRAFKRWTGTTPTKFRSRS